MKIIRTFLQGIPALNKYGSVCYVRFFAEKYLNAKILKFCKQTNVVNQKRWER